VFSVAFFHLTYRPSENIFISTTCPDATRYKKGQDFFIVVSKLLLMEPHPTVSVVIPTYNRLDLLPRAIDSALNQTYEDLECLVVDDASKRNPQSVIETYSDKRLRYLMHDKNKGLGAARNTGIENASGKYVAFLDDDDEWFPTKLEEQVQIFEQASDEVAIVYTWMNYYTQSGELVKKYHPTHEGDIFPDVLDGQPIGAGSTLLTRKSIVSEIGGFDESLPRGIDGDFIRRIARNYEIKYVPEVLVKYYVGHGHDRITSTDPQGIRNAIESEKIKFEKFGEELRNYPDRASNIYLQIADHYSKLRDWRNSVKYYIKAICTDPTNPSIYLHIPYSAKSLVSR